MTSEIIDNDLDADYTFLEAFLYEAIFQNPGAEPLPRSVIYEPELFAYIDGFGRPDDHCVVARVNDQIVGAVWVRIFSGDFVGYGRLDGSTPELSISVLPEHRGKGIGKMLMESMVSLLAQKGYPQVSLSVSKDNKALELYRSLGFEIVRESGDGFLMAKELQK